MTITVERGNGGSMGDTLYTLDELARAVGMTARNVRAYRTRGLLPPPDRIGRRAVYTERHLRRLLAVRSTLAQGVPLNMIAAWLANGRERELGRAPVGPPSRNARRARKPMSAELTQELIDADAQCIGTLIDLGVISHDGSDLYATPDMLSTVHELSAAGMPYKRLLELSVAVAQVAVDSAAEFPAKGRNRDRMTTDLLVRLVSCSIEEALGARPTR